MAEEPASMAEPFAALRRRAELIDVYRRDAGVGYILTPERAASLAVGHLSGQRAEIEAEVRERVAKRIEERYGEWAGRASPKGRRELIAKVAAYCARLAREGDLP